MFLKKFFGAPQQAFSHASQYHRAGLTVAKNARLSCKKTGAR